MPRSVTLRVLPSPAHGHDDPERAGAARRLDCRAYDRCLAVAVRRSWRAFHCRACHAYVPPSASERYRDHLALLELLADGQLTADAPRPAVTPAVPARLFLPDADDTVPRPIASLA